MRRIGELDAIRGIAAIAIVVFHVWLPQFGWLGYAVNLFFVLSGYLITTILLGNDFSGRFLLSFYARRALRIWPIYYVSLLAVVLINPLRNVSTTSLGDLPYYLTFTQEIRQWLWGGEVQFPLAFRHTWTLAIEEQFYVFWPAILALLGRRGLPWMSGGLIASSVAARWFDDNLFVLATQSDALALGGLLAGLLDTSKLSVGLFRISTSSLFVISVAALFGYAIVIGGARLGSFIPLIDTVSLVRALKPLFVNMLFFGIIGLLVRFAGHRGLAWLRSPLLVYLGSISFGIYLYHHIIIKYVEEYLASSGQPMTFGVEVAEVVASLALAALSWKYLEQPILALKDRFRYDAQSRSDIDDKRRRSLSDLANVELGRG